MKIKINSIYKLELDDPLDVEWEILSGDLDVDEKLLIKGIHLTSWMLGDERLTFDKQIVKVEFDKLSKNNKLKIDRYKRWTVNIEDEIEGRLLN